MAHESLFKIRDFIENMNHTKIDVFLPSMSNQTIAAVMKTLDISPLACIGFALLILTTVLGNIIVLAAIFLDRKLHTPSFLLIANMAVADLLLGIAVLPFSSVLELLNNRWIFGQGFCSAWLAIDVLCCTASIIGLAGVSIDRYIGVTQPLKYGSIMTIRRTIYLIIIIWAVSILTSVVPLFGLTDRTAILKTTNSSQEISEICEVNKNTFYTIFSSMVSFYIPVVILLILYSRIYQEAKEQGKKLENERRRLYTADYQIVSEQVRQQNNQTNGQVVNNSLIPHRSVGKRLDASSDLNSDRMYDEEISRDRSLTVQDGARLKRNFAEVQNDVDSSVSHCESSVGKRKSPLRSMLACVVSSTIRRNSVLHIPNPLHHQNNTHYYDELHVIKRKLDSLQSEKKAFRTVGLILGALLICWLPFFVTLPLMSILKHYEIIKNENTANTWFKLTFWLGYCNSALNPFVYAFSNRAIRRAYREVVCRRVCCSAVRQKQSKQYDEPTAKRPRSTQSMSLAADGMRLGAVRAASNSADAMRTLQKSQDDVETPLTELIQTQNSKVRTVSFVDAVAFDDDTDGSTLNENGQMNSENIPLSTNQKTSSNVNS